MCKTRIEAKSRQIPAADSSSLSISLITNGCENSASGVRYLEHLQARISLKYQPRGDLRISLKSPRGTTSHLLLPRPKDRVGSTFDNWPFLSVHYWGEDPTGEWELKIKNVGKKKAATPGILKHWQLVLHGTEQNPLESLKVFS